MTLRALFDEKRRHEIRDALKSGKAIEFRKKKPAMDETANGMTDAEPRFRSFEPAGIHFDFPQREDLRSEFSKIRKKPDTEANQ